MKMTLLICAALLARSECQDVEGRYLVKVEVPAIEGLDDLVACQRAGVLAFAQLSQLVLALPGGAWPKVFCEAGPRAGGSVG